MSDSINNISFSQKLNNDKNDPESEKSKEETLQSIFNNLAEGVIVADKDGKFLYFNPVAKEILGIGSKNVDSSEWSAIYGCYYPDKNTPYPSEQLPLSRALQNEEVYNDIIYINNPKRPEGIFIEVSAVPIRTVDGSVDGGTVIFHDITESKKLKSLQQQNEARIKAQFNGIPLPTYVWQFRDDAFYLVDYNKAANLMTDGHIKGMVGINLKEMYTDSEDINADFEKCFHEKSIITREMDYKFKSTGVKKNLIISYVYVPPDLVMVHTEDITERKKTEEELLQLFNAVEQTADSVIITDKRGVIEYVNPAFETTTGYSRAEAIGNTPGMLKSGQHDAAFYRDIWDTLLSGKPFLGRIVNRKKSGEFYWSEQTITPMTDYAGKIIKFVSVLKDITELKARQEQEVQLRIAREIQQKLLKTRISIPGFDIAGKTYPAVETSGDFYDFINLPDGSFGFVVGDVSGHGIGPALIMTQTRAYLRAFVKTKSDPGILLTLLNRELASDLDPELYVTLIFVRLDPQQKKLDYASAGHVSAYLMDGAGAIRMELESNGIPLGVMKEYTFNTSECVPLQAQDTLVLLTDGILEAHAHDDSEFGFERTLEVIRRNRQQRASEIVKHIFTEVNTFCGNQPQEDDITSIVCKVVADDSETDS